MSEKNCAACAKGVPPFPIEEVNTRIQALPGWAVEFDDIKSPYIFLTQTIHIPHPHIERRCYFQGKFPLSKFMVALRLAEQIGELAEKQGHHPDITFGWGYIYIRFQTHAISGLHENDFIMAAKVSSLIEEKMDTTVDGDTKLRQKIPAATVFMPKDLCPGTGGDHEWQDASKNTIVACTACGKIR